ncbi:MAG: spermidine synthase, partial [Armatimonadetes bacterium CG_4_9_14_3_um_filter_58_7]
GAAFMLLETRSVTSLALVYGSTWRVNAIVFFSILVMILLANLYVLKRPTHRTGTLYALLFVALILNYALPPHAFLSLSSLAGQVVTPAVVALPILLAALVFANSFRVSGQPSADIGWNIAGVMAGGLCENLSLLIGFQNLLLVAVLFYLISALTRPAAASAGCVNVATG